MLTWVGRVYGAIFVAMMAGCGDDLASLTVDLRTDLWAGVEFTTVETLVVVGESRTPTSTYEWVEGDDFINGVRVAELAELQPGNAQVLLVLREDDGRVVAEREASIELQGAVGVTLLVSRDCAGVECPGSGAVDATQCLGSRCVPETCTPETPETCGGALCFSDADCSSPVACADAVCAGLACLLMLDDSRCGPGEACDPELGCRSLSDITLDSDDDGVLDRVDNCDEVPNLDQDDFDGDDIGDACDDDADGDAIPDNEDNCLQLNDSNQSDLDSDGLGDPCDADADGDGHEGALGDAADCNDRNNTVHPDAIEIYYDGVDQDCSGDSDYDQDGDGTPGAEGGGTDCDDQDPTVTICGMSPGTAIAGWTCKELLADDASRPSGQYWIDLEGDGDPVPTWCEMEIAGGGWTSCMNNYSLHYDTAADWGSSVDAINDPPQNDAVSEEYDWCGHLLGEGYRSGDDYLVVWRNEDDTIWASGTSNGPSLTVSEWSDAMPAGLQGMYNLTMRSTTSSTNCGGYAGPLNWAISRVTFDSGCDVRINILGKPDDDQWNILSECAAAQWCYLESGPWTGSAGGSRTPTLIGDQIRAYVRSPD